MKEGYTFEHLNAIRLTYTTGGFRETEVKALFKAGAGKPWAVLSVFTRSGNMCHPQPNSPGELWDSTYARISTLEGKNATALLCGLP